MSNLLKSDRIVIKDNKLVIDSNRIIQDILAKRAESVIRNESGTGIIPDEDGFICGLDAATVEEITETENDTDVRAAADELMHRAEEALEAAKAEAESIRNSAREEGYAEGIKKAEDYVSDMLKERENTLEKEYLAKHKELEEEYGRKREQLEPELTEVLLDIFSRITHAVSEDKKDMILGLIKNVLDNSEVSRNIFIRVSAEDYSFVSNNRDKLLEAAVPDTVIEVTRDASLKKNQCIIETDAGVFDCSLDIQLENLISDIRLISRVRTE